MPRFFFITGTPRSGTTLLQAMLSRGQGVFIPPETHFMGLLWRQRKKLGPIASDDGWNAAKRALIRRNELATIALERARFEELAESGPRHYGTLMSAWLRAAAEAHASYDDQTPAIIGEKSPAHAQDILELLAMMPDSSVVHIIRDPRDVAASQREAWNTPTMSAAIRWTLDQKLQGDLETIVSPSRFVTVHYEDLVTDPESQLRRICDVLPMEYTAEMLEPHKRTAKGYADHETHKKRTLEPVTNSRVGRFRQKLPYWKIGAIERICGQQMDRLGYERVGARRPIPELGVATLALPMVWHKAITLTPANRIAKQARNA
ncbi:MAG: sulfotransferase [Phycisphaera sp.]|nr:MAG: sulfotransferase [Phycisphaera sp.]